MGVFQYENVKDPTYYGENRVPAHSDHRYYGSVEEMEQHRFTMETTSSGDVPFVPKSVPCHVMLPSPLTRP